ncbi:hypothetical protein Ab1vBOLIVR3_gp12c [Agrobacterium phage OLIVR3]|nr:hypothetical protein Ab1vBOLIVR3_gp12c [Agrobacterium phage OLIVR3]
MSILERKISHPTHTISVVHRTSCLVLGLPRLSSIIHGRINISVFTEPLALCLGYPGYHPLFMDELILVEVIFPSLRSGSSLFLWFNR